MSEEQLTAIPQKEATVRSLLALGLTPFDKVEFRVSASNEERIEKTAQRAVDAFYSATLLYPTALAVHPANAALLEAQETVIRAAFRGSNDALKELTGGLWETPPIHVEINDELDTKTVAVRLDINFKDYRDEAMTLIKEMLLGVKQ